MQTTSACYWASVCRAFSVGQLCSSVTLPKPQLGISCWWQTLPSGPQPAPFQCTHYTVPTKTALGSVYFSVLVFKPSISHCSAHIYYIPIKWPVLNQDIILHHRHAVLTWVSHIVAGKAYKSRTKEQIRPQVLWGDKTGQIQNLPDVVVPTVWSENVVVLAPASSSIVWNSPTLSPPTLVLTY